MKKYYAAFTLIELLIVVAIIAILAAIAVPNFMEAQVRSKVARVKADQRSLATAIEAYTVDYNRPPMCYRWNWGGEPPGCDEYRALGGTGVSSTQAHIDARARLTTPVAYMSGWPDDPFADKGTVWVFPPGAASPRLFGVYRYEDYWITWWGSPYARPLGYRWALGSPGPTRYNYLNLFAALAGRVNHSDQPVVFGPYDATNGTMSEGLIIRTNKGVWDKLEYE